MLLRGLPIFMMAVLATAPALVLAQQPLSRGLDSYRTLLTRLQAKDTTIDFTALRFAFTRDSGYAPYGSAAVVHWDSLGAALQRREFQRALTEADSALAIDYLDVRTHVQRAQAAEQLGDSSSALWDRVVAALLVRSIQRSGAGTVDSPFVIISVREEYALLGMTGFRRGKQALGRCARALCDILEAENRATGEERTFYFDISLPKTALDRMFQPK
jgi:hypothetical protein